MQGYQRLGLGHHSTDADLPEGEKMPPTDAKRENYRRTTEGTGSRRLPAAMWRRGTSAQDDIRSSAKKTSQCYGWELREKVLVTSGEKDQQECVLRCCGQ